MTRHAQRDDEPSRAVVVVTVVVVLVGALVLAMTTGVLGLPGGDDEPSASSSPSAAASSVLPDPAASPAVPAPADGTAGTAGAAAPAVPAPQAVLPGARLERTRAWLRRGLADATTFRVGSFNVLGASHTGPGGNKGGYASGAARMGAAYSLISQADLDVVGFQELEDSQYYSFRSMGGSSWDAFPGPTLDRGSIRDSIAWRTDVWELVEATSIAIPYFGGQPIRRPVVRLRNIDSDREVWFFNTHNPASTPAHGDNSRWRSAAIGLETTLANQLSADGTPVVFTGDYNDRQEVFCPLVGNTLLEAANGGSAAGACLPPDEMGIDWVFGSGIRWSGFTSAVQGVVGRVSDHPLVSAEAFVRGDPLPPDRLAILAAMTGGAARAGAGAGR